MTSQIRRGLKRNYAGGFYRKKRQITLADMRGHAQAYNRQSCPPHNQNARNGTPDNPIEHTICREGPDTWTFQGRENSNGGQHKAEGKKRFHLVASIWLASIS